MLNFTCKSFEELSLEELYEIMKIRQDVFVVEQDCPYLDADGKDQKGWHLMGRDEDHEMVAYTRLLPKGVSYDEYPSIGRVLTTEKIRRNGSGKLLMNVSIEWMKKLFGNTAIKIGAQCYLEKFYQSFGFEPEGEPYLEDGIPHVIMVRPKQG